MSTTYQHGIYGSYAKTRVPITNASEGGIQCVIGTAPVNLLDNPAGAVGVPIPLNGWDDVDASIGSSDDVDKYTIMQAVHCTFELFQVAPIIVINVLDPAKHTTAQNAERALANGETTLSDQGILLSTLVLTSDDGTTTYASGTDYTAAFDDSGLVVVTMVTGGKLTATSTIKAAYSVLDPTKVTDADIIAGIALVDRVYPFLGYDPDTLLAPGWSQNADVAAALIAASKKISTVFKGTALSDIDPAANKTIAAAIAAKTANGLNVRDCIPCWPKVITTSGITVWYSAMWGAAMQYNDYLNSSTALKSPSNKALPIQATVLGDGTQVMLMPDEANQLNAEGIVTALRFAGWKSWGNNTGIYSQTAEKAGASFDVKDRWINIKRSFDWQNNGFVQRYWSKVDDSTNYKQIQSFITGENAYYNTFIGAGLVAGMEVIFNQTENQITQIMDGLVKFHQKIAFYPPMEAVENVMEFDPDILQAALSGGSNS